MGESEIQKQIRSLIVQLKRMHANNKAREEYEHIKTVLQGAFEERVSAIAGKSLDQYLRVQGLNGMPSLYSKPKDMDGTDLALQDIAMAIATERADLLSVNERWKSNAGKLKHYRGMLGSIERIIKGFEKNNKKLQKKVLKRTSEVVSANLGLGQVAKNMSDLKVETATKTLIKVTGARPRVETGAKAGVSELAKKFGGQVKPKRQGAKP